MIPPHSPQQMHSVAARVRINWVEMVKALDASEAEHKEDIVPKILDAFEVLIHCVVAPWLLAMGTIDVSSASYPAAAVLIMVTAVVMDAIVRKIEGAFSATLLSVGDGDARLARSVLYLSYYFARWYSGKV